jgi:exodeoxyribonuclease-3
MTSVRLVTLNVGAASKDRARRIVDEWIKPANYDVFVFTETSDGEGTALIISELADVGWSISRSPTLPNDRGVTVASRIRTQRSDEHLGSDPVPGRGLILQLDTNPRLELVAMYVPNRGNDAAKTERKRAYLNFWLKRLQQRGLPTYQVLMGDLNVVPPEQHPQFLPQQQFEYKWYAALSEMCQLYDAAVHHNSSGHESTWVASSNEGYTYDHIFVDTRLKQSVKGFQYDHSTRRRGGVTDHSALALEIVVDSCVYLDTYEVGTPRQGGLF